MQKKSLTDLTIPRLPPGYHWDATLSAFGIRVGKTSRTFVYVRSGKRTTLGRYPEISLKAARKKAAAIFAGLTGEVSPEISTITEDAVQIYLSAHQGRKRTVSEYERVLISYLVRALGRTPLQDIKTSQITAITNRLADTPAEQNHVHRIHSAFFSWAYRRRIISHNPMRDLPLPSRPRIRTRVLTDHELSSIYRAAQDIGCPFGFIVLICIHTGMRRTEAASLKWSYITHDTICLPPEVTKNNTPLTIPNLINENLALIPRRGELLFPSSVGRLFNSWGKAKERLDLLSDTT
ncbi:MAG: integrase arm-type DNA-binding domain-containing protein, partial [Hyphomicrobiaceae bacterium]